MLRVVAVPVVIAIGAGIALHRLAGARKYLRFAQKLAKSAVIIALTVFVPMVFEQLVALS